MKNRHSIVCAAYLLLVKDNKILLLRRFNTGYEDGKYSLPAGHVDEGESIEGCLIKEAKEEIGISVARENLELKHVMHRKATDYNGERLDFFFSCTSWKGEIKNMEPDKCDDLSWFEIDELPDNLIFYVQTAIINSLVDNKIYSGLHW